MTNTLLLYMDDARWDAPQYMPNVRRFAHEHGVEFTCAWCPSPVCIPSRANLLYGQYPSRTNIWAIDTDDIDDAIAGGTWSYQNLGRWLHDAGVSTAHLGKYHTSQPAPLASEGWDYSRTIVPQQNHFGGTIYRQDGTTTTMPEWHSAYFADRCLDHITASGSDPWSIIWNTSSPHWQFSSQPRHMWKHTRVGHNHTEPQNGTGWPSWVTDDLPVVSDWASIRDTMRCQARECLDADEHLALVLEEVDLDDTLVIVTSDNGLHYGDHRMTGPGTKNTLYSAAARTPMLMFGAGCEAYAGDVVDAPVAMVDVTATILAAHGATAPVPQDGIDLLTIAEDPEAYDDRIVYLFHRPTPVIADVYPTQVAAVSKTAKLIHSLDVDPSDEWELYDLVEDPGELVNLADDAGWSDVRDDLEAALDDIPT